jgi:hypothetical protein
MKNKSISSNKVAILIRGVSGSTKSSFAQYIKEIENIDENGAAIICEADDYYIEKYGSYKWNPQEIGLAHKWCQEKFKKALYDGISPVICSNTSTKNSEVDFYLNLAKEFGYVVFCMVMENRNETKNTHNVPEESLLKQERNIKESLKLR